MKLFVISDIHGCFTETKTELDNAGYDENNKDHLLIVLGDMFDRGEESAEIYEWLRKLSDDHKAVVLHGNHEDFLIDFLKGKDCSFNFAHNGFNKTLDSLLQQTRSWEMFMFLCSSDRETAKAIYGNEVEVLLGDTYSVPVEVRFEYFQDYARDMILRDYPGILEWLDSLPYYYETEKYIFTHASIDGSCEDWHNPTYSKYEDWTPWRWLTWDDGRFYEKPLDNTDKTVVVGHFYTDRVREMYGIEYSSKENDILYGDRKIFIDTCTPYTKRVNVLVIEDNLIQEG